MTQITWLRLLLLLVFILRHLRGLGQLQVILALLAHAVGVGAATILPLHTDPAVLPQLSNHTAQAWRRPVLKEALDTLTALHIIICVRLLKEALDTLTALHIIICIRLLKEALDTLTALHIIICVRLLKEALDTLTALHIMIWIRFLKEASNKFTVSWTTLTCSMFMSIIRAPASNTVPSLHLAC